MMDSMNQEVHQTLRLNQVLLTLSLNLSMTLFGHSKYKNIVKTVTPQTPFYQKPITKTLITSENYM